MSAKQLFERLLHADMYKKVLDETRERSLKMIEDTKKRRKLHGKTEVFNEIQESGTALITSIDESLLNLAREKQQALQLIECLDDDRFKAILLLRYMYNRTWEEIAGAIPCTVSYAHKLHNKALKILDQL